MVNVLIHLHFLFFFKNCAMVVDVINCKKNRKFFIFFLFFFFLKTIV
jgi:hypothetical protein